MIKYAKIKVTTYETLYQLKTQLSQNDFFWLKPFLERTAYIVYTVGYFDVRIPRPSDRNPVTI